MARAAVFLDRDGTIIREADYLTSVAQLRLLPGAANAIKQLNDVGLAVVIVTNQSGIARGRLTEADFHAINTELLRRLARYGARVEATYYCPHHPEYGSATYGRDCDCRKPSPGLLLQAARELDLELTRSFMVGDSNRDMEAGRRAGCSTVLVRTGYGRREEAANGPPPDYIAGNLATAVAWVLDHPRSG